jgi:hypothetical protein
MKIALHTSKGPALLGLFLACMPLTAFAHGAEVGAAVAGFLGGALCGVVLGVILIRRRRPGLLGGLLMFVFSVIGCIVLGITVTSIMLEMHKRDAMDAHYEEQIKRQTRDAGKQ